MVKDILIGALLGLSMVFVLAVALFTTLALAVMGYLSGDWMFFTGLVIGLLLDRVGVVIARLIGRHISLA